MSVGLLVIDCILPASQSLKDKRHILKSLSERIRRGFNVAICETEYQDQWQRTQLVIAFVNTNWRMLQGSMAKVIEFIERDRRVMLLDSQARRLC